MSEKIAIRTAKAPKPAAAYSQGVGKGGILQIAGQGPGGPVTGQFIGLVQGMLVEIDALAVVG